MNIDKEEVRKFLDEQPNPEYSVAKFAYSMMLYDGIEKEAGKLLYKIEKKKVKDIKDEQLIKDAHSANTLIKMMMNNDFSLANVVLLKEKLIKNEMVIIDSIKTRMMTTNNNKFIEMIFEFFVKCNTNYCDWLFENYHNFKSEYLKSLICLVFGFRGDLKYIPFLMNETERFKKDCPNQNLEQGPILGVQELSVRLLNDE